MSAILFEVGSFVDEVKIIQIVPLRDLEGSIFQSFNLRSVEIERILGACLGIISFERRVSEVDETGGYAIQ